MSLSLCMIVKNEEHTIARCVESVKDLVDEIVVVDTGSGDNTAAAAEKMGALVYDYEWDDSFANARNFALSKARMDWILVMDADDELERGDREKLMSLIKTPPGDALVYCCQTMCYTGSVPDLNNVLVNMNVRLIRNGKGCRYRGRIHEQLVFAEGDDHKPASIVATDVRFHHYGYLTSYIQSKDKHTRNIRLIRKELEDRPKDPFMLFSLGNEYCSLQEPQKALACYQQSLEHFDAGESFYAFLLIRMILCHEALGNDGDIFRIADMGLRHYPRLTDFEFLRANARNRRGELGKAVRSYKKCIRMGTPPANASSIAGVADFRPQYALASVYLRLGERGKALLHCRKALKYHGAHKGALSMAMDILLQKGKTAGAIKNSLVSRLPAGAGPLLLLSDLFYDRGKYKQARDLARRAMKLEPGNGYALYSAGLTSLLMGETTTAKRYLKKTLNMEEYTSRAAFLLYFCQEPRGRSGENRLLKLLDPEHRAAVRVFRMVQSGCLRVLPDAGEKKDPDAVFHILELLIKSARLEEFRAGLSMVRHLEDGDMQLRLGKLYFRNGYLRLAWHEFTRSIARGGRIDGEALDMMKGILAASGTRREPGKKGTDRPDESFSPCGGSLQTF